MKTKFLSLAGFGVLTLTLAPLSPARASDESAISYGKQPVVDAAETATLSTLWDPSRPDSHAPIGVMGDHTHEAGEFMLGYQYMYMSMDGHRAGTDSLSTSEVFDRGFGVAAEQMDMHMHMFMIMHAPTDWLTLMAMLNYIEKDMELVSDPTPPHGAAGGGHGHGAPGGRFGHSSAGLGDTSLGALIKVYDASRQRVHLNLNVVFPTAEVDEKQAGQFLPYGMQLGSGTWDLKPGITYLGQYASFSWGVQAMGTIRLEDENDSGFVYGNAFDLTKWMAYRLSDSFSASVRVAYHYAEDINGHYNGPHGHVAPPHFQPNYGGHYLDLGAGLIYKVQSGPLKGHRLAIEALAPVYQDLNGVGMNREFTLVAGWQYAF